MAPRRKRLTPLQRLSLWLFTFAGGATTGTGLFLIGQVRLIRYVRHELDSISAIERFLGSATFLWRSLDEKLALAMGDIPEAYLVHTHRVGVVLALIGCPLLTLAVPFVLRLRWSR